MNFLDMIKLKQNDKLNSKGGIYQESTLDYNLDLFAASLRGVSENEIRDMFRLAYGEDKSLAVANLLYILDIRSGKGERFVFKACYKELISLDKAMAVKLLTIIGELGRYDYILVGMGTSIETNVINFIKYQVKLDMNTLEPTLLGKWLPSLRTHGKNNPVAKRIAKELGGEKQYRFILKTLRNRLNIVETKLTNRDVIDLGSIPSKALVKYRKVLTENYGLENFIEHNEEKVKSTNLFMYEMLDVLRSGDTSLANALWNNQKDIKIDKNVLVMADTSGSMSGIPFDVSVGLAMYTAERNTGMFAEHYMTFDAEPRLRKLIGNTFSEKYRNIEHIHPRSTNIDKAFKLLLDTASENNVPQSDMPEYLLIVSDMEFDEGVMSRGGTNFKGWKSAFESKEYKLPKIIFWNVAMMTNGYPVTKFDTDVAMIGGFSTNIFENLFTLENLSPINLMFNKLSTYKEILEKLI